MTNPRILILDEVDSTNTYAKVHFEELADGTLVVARCQTAGRGRRGRRWIAPPNRCILCTMVVKRIQDGFHAGALLGLGALECLRSASPGIIAFLKWPNDIYIEDRKIAGVLSESAHVEAGRVTGVVAGIGINVNLQTDELEKIEQPATSLLQVAGVEFDIDFLLESLEKILNRRYNIYLTCPTEMLAEWKVENRLIGEQITVVDPLGQEHTGSFRDILPDGSMLLEEAGKLRTFSCGDVRIDRASINWEHLRSRIESQLS